MEYAIETVFKGICHLGECPVWNAEQQKLYWTDIYKKRIWVYDPAASSSTVFWEGNLQVGGFAFTKQGGMVLFTDRGVHTVSPAEIGRQSAVPELLYDFAFSPGEMFNDITVDPAGRIYAGTLNRNTFSDGTLYLLTKDKSPEILLKGLKCSNGMTFSRDLRYFFHADSLDYRITRYAYHAASGSISNPEAFYQGNSQTGLPDGITADAEGYIWAAFWGSSTVRRISAEGRIAEEIRFPARQTSSVMFGGKNLDELYVTSSCQDAVDLETGRDSQGSFLGGPVYRVKTSVRGRMEWLADI